MPITETSAANINIQDGLLSIKLLEELSINTIDNFLDRLKPMLNNDVISAIEINAGTIKHLDTAGLQSLLQLSTLAKNNTWQFSITESSEMLNEYTELFNLDTVLPVNKEQ